MSNLLDWLNDFKLIWHSSQKNIWNIFSYYFKSTLPIKFQFNLINKRPLRWSKEVVVPKYAVLNIAVVELKIKLIKKHLWRYLLWNTKCSFRPILDQCSTNGEIFLLICSFNILVKHLWRKVIFSKFWDLWQHIR